MPPLARTGSGMGLRLADFGRPFEREKALDNHRIADFE